jgi:hypothetical protein
LPLCLPHLGLVIPKNNFPALTRKPTILAPGEEQGIASPASCLTTCFLLAPSILGVPNSFSFLSYSELLHHSCHLELLYLAGKLLFTSQNLALPDGMVLSHRCCPLGLEHMALAASLFLPHVDNTVLDRQARWGHHRSCALKNRQLEVWRGRDAGHTEKPKVPPVGLALCVIGASP